VRKRGQSWCIVYDLPRGPDGKRDQRWKYGFATRRDAEAALSQIMADLHGGTHSEPSRLAFRRFVDDKWLPTASLTIRPSTYESYERNLRLHVYPTLGDVELRRIDAPQLNALYADLLHAGRSDGKGGLSPRSVHYVHTIIHRVLRDAVRWGFLAANAAQRADPPRLGAYRRTVAQVWSLAEVRAFLDGTSDDRLTALWVLMASTGLRRGEAIGLSWDHVDIDQAHIRVVRSLICVRNELSWSEPTTARGRRVVALDASTVDAIRHHRARQAAEQLALGAGYQDQKLVFARADGSTLHPKLVSDEFQKRARDLGLPVIRLHDLRHTYATLALQAGVQTKVLSERIGHASTAITTDIYQHVTDEMQHDAAVRVGKLLFGG
jgi:integrase